MTVGAAVIKLTTPPMASLPYREDDGPLMTSILLVAAIFISSKALWLYKPEVRIGIPSSKYKNKLLVVIGWRMLISCCSLPRFTIFTPLTLLSTWSAMA